MSSFGDWVFDRGITRCCISGPNWIWATWVLPSSSQLPSINVFLASLVPLQHQLNLRLSPIGQWSSFVAQAVPTTAYLAMAFFAVYVFSSLLTMRKSSWIDLLWFFFILSVSSAVLFDSTFNYEHAYATCCPDDNNSNFLFIGNYCINIGSFAIRRRDCRRIF